MPVFPDRTCDAFIRRAELDPLNLQFTIAQLVPVLVPPASKAPENKFQPPPELPSKFPLSPVPKTIRSFVVVDLNLKTM